MLLEREGQLSALAGLVEGLGAAGGKVVLIRGEVGIGKSALVSEFLNGQQGRADVLLGGCDDLFIPQPLGPSGTWRAQRSSCAPRCTRATAMACSTT